MALEQPWIGRDDVSEQLLDIGLRVARNTGTDDSAQVDTGAAEFLKELLLADRAPRAWNFDAHLTPTGKPGVGDPAIQA